MSANFTGNAPGAAKTDPGKTQNLNDTPLQDEEHSYHAKMFTGVFKTFVGLLSNAFEVFSSAIGLAILASGGTLTLSSMHPSILLGVCVFVAFLVQGFLHHFSMSNASTWNRLRAIRIHDIKGLTDKDMYVEAWSIVASMNTLYLVMTLVFDIVGNATFARSLSPNFFFVFAVAFLPPGGSTILLYSGLTTLYGAMQDIRAHISYSNKYHGTTTTK